MARHASSPAPASLPKVSFTKVLDEYSSHPAGVADLQARSYGYNDGSNFKRPDNYIRYIEPLESELAQQVEYDMDDQDREWLESVNADRRKEQLDKVSYEVFEIVMDKLEKEWFDLTKTIPKPDFAMPSEDSTCAICDDSEGENTNAIVFCDGCNLAVHQDCYGVPYIPEGQWLCRKCTVSPENPVSCILCPNEGGAFKQTVQGEWVHLLCAIWVPETRVANEVFMEPITGVDTITKPRWRLKCSLCDVRMGACIQCIKSSCTLAFHATCARKEKLLMPMKATQGSEAPVLACYCEKHLPREQAEARAAALASEKVDGVGDADNQKSSKTARAYAKTYKLGPPLVPKIIVDRLMQYIGKVTLRQKREFVILVCKYWSLKREARRGAPLLKRLHLEPWTASNSGRNHSEEDKLIKLEMLKKLKTDLDKTRELAQLSKQRETQKLLQARAVYKLLKRTLLPSQSALRAAFARIVGFDRQDFFKSPVSRIDVPDYYDIVKQPICWDVIDKKLSSYEYMDLDDLKKDVYLVLDNALLYNRPDTPYSKAALKIKSHADRILTELEQAKVLHPELPDNSAESSEPEASSSRLLVGDLEPPLEVLQPLFSRDSIANDMETILETDPMTSLFSFEFAKEKPPPTPPPPKPKRDRKADLDRARQERIAVAGERAMTRSTGGALTDSSRPSLEPIDAELVEGQVHEDHHDERRRKRPKIVLPGHADVPPVVDEVDGREMFMKFDVGWILPDTTRRGGRAPVDRHPIEPRRKKPKTERERSHLSTEGTAVAQEDMAGPSGHAHEGEATTNSVPMHVPEDEAVKMQVDDAVQLPETPQPDSAMDVSPLVASDAPVPVVDPQPSNTEMDLALDQEQPVTEKTPDIVNAIIYPPDSIPVNTDIQVETQREESLNEAAAEVGPEAGVEAETRAEAEVDAAAQGEEEEEDERPVQVIVIDVLDTPATRREKNMRRKAERLRKSSFGGPQPGPSRPDNGEHSIDMQNSGNPDSDAHSELTALSSDEDDQDDRNSGENAIAPEPSHEVRVQDLGKVILEKDQRLPHKTLVWAKTLGYPWWPASVVDPDSPDATLAPKASDPVKARKEQLHLVRYFDGKNGKVDDTWQWVSPPNMRLFGNFEELDEDMVANKSKMQRWNKEKAKSQCRKAYQRAKEESSGDRPITQVAKPNDAEPQRRQLAAAE